MHGSIAILSKQIVEGLVSCLQITRVFPLRHSARQSQNLLLYVGVQSLASEALDTLHRCVMDSAIARRMTSEG